MRKSLKRIRDARRHPKLESHFLGLDSPLRPEICPGYLGVDQVIDGVAEEHGDCIDTDKDGDQILWKTTEEPRHYFTPIIAITEEAVAGTGKFSGRSTTQTLNCGYSMSGEDESVFGWDCDVHGKYKLP
jgi:hypothetical protein